jgi:hypothetical protein
MKLKPWIHSALHLGCVVLLLLQGHRIHQMRKVAVERITMEANHQVLDSDSAKPESLKVLDDQLAGRACLMRGLSGVGVSSTKLKNYGCYRWGHSIDESQETYVCFSMGPFR